MRKPQHLFESFTWQSELQLKNVKVRLKKVFCGCLFYNTWYVKARLQLSIVLRSLFTSVMKNKTVTWRPWDGWKYRAVASQTDEPSMWEPVQQSLAITPHRRPIRHTALKQDDHNQSPMLIMRNIFFSASEKIISSWTEGSTGPLYTDRAKQITRTSMSLHSGIAQSLHMITRTFILADP